MNLMIRIFASFVRKEIYHILRDTRTLIILFGMPVALVLIFGYTISNEFTGASITVLDQSRDELSESLVYHLVSSGHFEIVENAENVNDIDAFFKKGLIKFAIVIPPNFEKEFFQNRASIQFIADATEPNYATSLTSYASGMVRSFVRMNRKERTGGIQIDTATRMYYNPGLSSAYNFIPGVVAFLLMLICAMMTSLTIAKEKEVGTMDLLLVSPLPPLIIILGKVTPYAILSFISALVVFGMGYFIFDVPIVGSTFLLLLLCLLYLFVALALGILISTKAKSMQMAMIMSLFSLLMPTMLLSGFLFPIQSMPIILQYISKVIPAKYFIIIEKAIMLKGVGVDHIWEPILVLLGMFVVLIVASWRSFKVVYK